MKKHLLVVDDEAAICEMLSDYLQHYGYEVTTVGCCHDALDLLKEMSPHLIILDVMLPDMDGLDLLEIIKKDYPATPVLVLTGIGFLDDAMQEAKDRGANGYVSKGLPLQQLLMEIHRVIRHPGGLSVTH